MKITKFGLSNFRVFKEHYDFDLAPIMVLTGPNNSGKSSLTKALLLIKENADIINSEHHYFSKFNYFKGNHDLGNHGFTINTKEETTVFAFTFFKDYRFNVVLNNNGEFVWDYSIEDKHIGMIICQNQNIIKINVENIIQYFSDRIEFLISNRRLKGGITGWQVNRFERFLSKLVDFGNEFNFIDVDLFGGGENKSEFTHDNNKRIFNSYIVTDNFDLKNFNWAGMDVGCANHLILLFYEITKVELTTDDINFLIPPAKSEFIEIPKLIYVNTIKEPIKRAYNKNDFSDFRSLIYNEINRELVEPTDGEARFINRINVGKKEFNLSKFEGGGVYGNFVSKWLKAFEIGGKLTYGYDEERDIFFIKIDQKFLPEYGLGYSVILHLLLFLNNEIIDAFVKERNINENTFLKFPRTYIIEEPETGLHPAFQSKMAEMIVDIQKTFNVNLIVETHSEYLIRKLQYLTATNEVGSGNVVIYYFNNPKKVPEGEEQIKRITILKDGSLSDNFGPGFIDEGINLKFELLRLNKSQIN